MTDPSPRLRRSVLYMPASNRRMIDKARALCPALCLALPELGVAVAPALLALYNGTRGRGGAVAGWAFYLFYPLHLLLIDLLL